MRSLQFIARSLVVTTVFLGVSLVPIQAAVAVADPASEPSVIAAAKGLPAVVNVSTEGIIRQTYRDPADEFYNQFFGGRIQGSRELRQKVQSLGSGFIVDASGYIITNQHVVERSEDLKIHVTTPDGKTYTAQYITGDPEADLALLKIESKTPLPFISLKDTSPNLLGETVLVLGNPLGYGHSVARGILSATNRSLTVEQTEYKNLLQTDAAINPGNSGGPLIDLSGKLVGVASAKMAYTPQGVPTQGIGFAIPAATVAAKVEEFRRAVPKRVQGDSDADLASAAHHLLGLTLQELTPDLSDAMGVSNGSGVLISDVEPGSPSEKSGLRRGLLIYRVGRYNVNSPGDIEGLLQRAKHGTVIDLSVGLVRRINGRLQQQVDTVTVVAR